MIEQNNHKIAVLQFPGSNCETETARALKSFGLNPVVFRWNRPSEELTDFSAFVIPGGFSYEDRVRAGVIAAKEPIFSVLTQQAEAGKPILGICNGAQILLETGLLPGLNPGKVEMALAHNYMTHNGKVVRRGHHCGWINMISEMEPGRTPFTNLLSKGQIVPITVSHGEGRFVSEDESVLQALVDNKQILWRYCDENGVSSDGFPVNPNGSFQNIAGLCNPEGNVVALMPHPERAFYLRQVPSMWPGEWGKKKRESTGKKDQFNSPGPGYAIFESLANYLKNQC
jgi:phosphoribosylformylglycinamidine synthase I